MDAHFVCRILFALAGCAWVAVCQKCERAHFESCTEQLARFAGRDDLLFADSPEQLSDRCLSAQSSSACVSRYIKKCVDQEERKEYSDNVSGLLKLTEALCGENSQLRPRYLSSLPCFRNVSEGIHFCQDKFRRNQNDILQVPYSEKTPLFCCSFDGYRRCLRMLLSLREEEEEGSCRGEEGAVMDEVVQKLVGVLGEGACDEYAERCTGGGASAPLAGAALLSAALLFGTVLLP